ncbi:DUF2254 family protein [Streptomyces sp. NPDC056944]|uniref:DUF2254 family protein n=1 Tax=Streptomyces sp. NPDC056944 TaxID=3345972 RepID=UPI0036351B9A
MRIILVDIAVRALSPAANGPTTAVQVINYIESFLHTVGNTRLPGRYVLADRHEHARLVLRGHDWENFLQLAECEIREYGRSSVQICRRLHAMLESLPPSQHAAVRTESGCCRSRSTGSSPTRPAGPSLTHSAGARSGESCRPHA